MPLPATYTPLRLAVAHALTSDTGKPRALPSDMLLSLGLPAELRQSTGRTAAGSKKRTVDVAVRDPLAIDTHLTLSDRMRSEVSVIITIRQVVNPRHAREVESMRSEMEALEPRIRAALTYPGALQTSPDGEPTGLDSLSLRDDGGRYRVAGPRILAAQAQHMAELVMTFRTTVELSQPTT